jgi:hypothetical protein
MQIGGMKVSLPLGITMKGVLPLVAWTLNSCYRTSDEFYSHEQQARRSDGLKFEAMAGPS